MLVIISYDISTQTKEGRRRLRRVSKACLDYGQRVQYSVFECNVDPEQFARLKIRLLDVFKPEEDSLRFYFLGAHWQGRVEHHGVKPSIDMKGPLIV
ncbi:MAG: CRISPR-associated endonuclease Cas2 [Pseudomonadota bacterium]